MDMKNWPKGDWESVYSTLRECLRKMQNTMFECAESDERAKRFAQDCCDGIETWIENCKRKGHIEEHTLDLTSSKKLIKSDDTRISYYCNFTNTGYYEDDLNTLKVVPEDGDGTVFSIEMCNEDTGETINKKEFDITQLMGGPIASSKKPIKSGNDKPWWEYEDNTEEPRWWEHNEDEDEPLSQSKKPVKSSLLEDIQMDIYEAVANGKELDKQNEEENIKATVEYFMEEYPELDENELRKYVTKKVEEYYGGLYSSKKPVKSAMPGKEKYIQAVMDEYGCSREEAEEIIADQIQSSRKVLKNEKLWPGFDKNGEVYFYDYDEYVETFGEEPDDKDALDDIESGCHGKSKKEKKEKKPEKIEQTRRARNTESLNNLYGKMF